MNKCSHRLTFVALTVLGTALLVGMGCGAKRNTGATVEAVAMEPVLQPGPHGGKLVPIGGRRYFFEFVFAPPAGDLQTNRAGRPVVVPEQRGSRLNCYLLDATAKMPANHSIGLEVAARNWMGDQVLQFMPGTDQRDLALGRLGLMYTAQSKWIDEQETIEGVVKRIQIGKEVFADVPIKVSRRDMHLLGNL